MADQKTTNIDTVVKEVNLVERDSVKTGKPYKAIEIVLENGYTILVFQDRAVMYMIDSLVSETAK